VAFDEIEKAGAFLSHHDCHFLFLCVLVFSLVHSDLILGLNKGSKEVLKQLKKKKKKKKKKSHGKVRMFSHT